MADGTEHPLFNKKPDDVEIPPISAEEEDIPRLTGHNAILLEMLRQGPVTNAQMCDAIGTMRHGARIYDLREYLEPMGQGILRRSLGGGLHIYSIEPLAKI